MYRQEDWMEVKVMHRQGASIRAIAPTYDAVGGK